MAASAAPAEQESPFTGDEWITFLPWQGAPGYEYVDGQRVSSCLIRRLTKFPDLTIIDVEKDTHGVYLVFGPGPEAVMTMEG